MKKVLAVFGTRPDAVKMCPLVGELKSRRGIETVVCVSGQHREMLEGILRTFGLVPDYDLSVMRTGQSLFDITARVMDGVRAVLEKEKPDLVLVHGDTTTALCAAMSAFYLHIPVAHVEAGLRTDDVSSPYPEEFNRRAISLISELDFAPNGAARDALLSEGKSAERVFLTGNTVLDALAETVKPGYSCPVLEWAQGSRLVLLTTHRRENIGEPMRNIFRAVGRIADEFGDVKVVYPVHPNPEIGGLAREMLGGRERIMLTDPIGVVDFHNVLANAHLVLTDSGGVQEEAAALGKPTLILRRQSEQREEVPSGVLVPTGTCEDVVYKSAVRLLEEASTHTLKARAVEGGASRRIADIICAQ